MDLERKKKTYKVNHAKPGDFHLGYILMPVGYSYNADLREAKKGDILRLWTGESFPIFAVKRLELRKAAADILCRMRYGITIKRALQIWQGNAKMQGHGVKAVSTEECLWIIYDEENPM